MKSHQANNINRKKAIDSNQWSCGMGKIDANLLTRHPYLAQNTTNIPKTRVFWPITIFLDLKTKCTAQFHRIYLSAYRLIRWISVSYSISTRFNYLYIDFVSGRVFSVFILFVYSFVRSFFIHSSMFYFIHVIVLIALLHSSRTV